MARNESQIGSGEVPEAKALPQEAVIFDALTISGRKPTRLERRFLSLAASHVLEHPDEPMDSKIAAREMGTSKQVMSKLRARLRKSGLEIPLSPSEFAAKARIEGEAARQEQIKEKEAARQRRIIENELLMVQIMSLRNSANLTAKELSRRVGKSQKVVENRLAVLLDEESAKRLRSKKKTSVELVVFDKDVASFYKQDLTYNEIAWTMDSSYSSIVGSLERSADAGQIIRRRDPRKKK